MNLRPIFVALLMAGGFICRSQVSLRPVTSVASSGGSAARIAVHSTEFDSLALRETPSISLADVMAYNAGVFVKNHGRASLSTVTFRGTSPSHTKVLWNGISVNSPMVGMTDFSTIPSHLVDHASLLHGSSSVVQAGGGLGGVVSLSSSADPFLDGWRVNYIQGIGSYKTFDEFLRVDYGCGRWSSSTRASVSTSDNDFPYINYDKKENIYDDNHQIISQYYPKERNRSGAWRDVHVLQDIELFPAASHRLALNAWYYDSRRELPMLTVDYAAPSDFENVTMERTARVSASWNHGSRPWNFEARAGYVNSFMAYDYSIDAGAGIMSRLTASRTRLNSLIGQVKATWSAVSNLHVELSWSGTCHWLHSSNINSPGFDVKELQTSAALAVRWRPLTRVGTQLIIREESYGKNFTAPIPALLAEYNFTDWGELTLKASVSRNYCHPTLNDLYFLPGGNPDLKSERGFTYDAGVSGCWKVEETALVSLDASWFDSRIDRWIQWLPSSRGFYSPRNVGRVHAYGIESRASVMIMPGRGWTLNLSGNFSWTPSVRSDRSFGYADMSQGRQLPYTPRYSASVVADVKWHQWQMTYKWLHYSRRFTQTTEQIDPHGVLKPYYMSELSLGRGFTFRPCDFMIKGVIHNLLNTRYKSELARPMPGINFQLIVSVTPKFFRCG